jgi:hypothetical protein
MRKNKSVSQNPDGDGGKHTPVGFIDDENRSDKYRKMPKRNRVRIKKKVGD